MRTGILRVIVAIFTAIMVVVSSPPMVENEMAGEPRLIAMNIEEASSHGGYLQAIIVNGQVQYIYARIFGVMGQVAFNYSFVDGNSVFISIMDYHYNMPQAFDVPHITTISHTETERFFLTGDRLYIIPVESNEMREADDGRRERVIWGIETFMEMVNQYLANERG